MRVRLRAVRDGARHEAAAAACGRVGTPPQWAAARCVLLYAPLPEELGPLALFAAGGGRTFCVPRVASLDPPTLHAAAVDGPPDADSPAWRGGPFDLWEPAGPPLDPRDIDFALIPGLAFTRDGRRLGRGKGFYDRFLTTLRPDCFTCGLGHDLQLVEDLPTEPHDVTLDAVVTPAGVWR